jgi:hypothetical protein
VPRARADVTTQDLYAAVTINEMFHNNRALCSQITEVQIRKIVNAIETNKLPRYIQILTVRSFTWPLAHHNPTLACCSWYVTLLLTAIALVKTLIMPNDIPLRRNQNLVLKMLMEKQQTTLVLFNDPESIEYRYVT